MLRNYILIATRNLKNSAFYSVINIVGLSVGIACCLVISLYILDELSFDKHHVHVDKIYRVVNKQVDGNSSNNVAVTQGPLAPEVKKNFAEVEAATRVAMLNENINIEGKEPVEEKLIAVDADYFKIFTVPFLLVFDKDSLITDKGILISESAAQKLFGKANALGKIITIEGMADLEVRGIYRNMPAQTHLYSDYIISFTWREKLEPKTSSWNFNMLYTYVMLREGTDITAFNNKLDKFVKQHIPESWKSFSYFLQPLRDIHANDSYLGNPSPAIGRTIIISFVSVGLIVLMLACFNYMNMATARTNKRALEVGVRKAMGAQKLQLIGQFLAESFILCTLSFLLAILLADLALPFFNAFLNMQEGESRAFKMTALFSDANIVASMVACNIILAVVSGAYPAFYLSRFIPSAVLKGQQVKDSSRRLRKALVLTQFTLTGILIILAIVVFRQIDFMKSKDLGFNKDKLLLFAAARNNDISLESFKATLTGIAGVKQVTTTSALPGRGMSTTDIRQASATDDANIKIHWMFTDQDYIPTLGLQLIAGRNFYSNGSDENRGVIINETTSAALGLAPGDAIGKRIVGFIFNDSLPGEIIGVVKDYHATSLRTTIAPMVIGYGTYENKYLARLDGNNVNAIRHQIEAKVKTLIPDKPFDSVLMNDFLDKIYQPESKIAQLLTFFTVLAVIIGCLGLYALSAYEGEQRIKELGIRKVMGATSTQLVILLSSGFLKLVMISLVVAMPLAWMLGNLWLQSFAYRAGWSSVLFVEASLLMLSIGWLTILAQALKAARLNPVETLRHE